MKLFCLYPFDFLIIQRQWIGRIFCEDAADEENANELIGIVVFQGMDTIQRDYLNSQFFATFAYDTFFRCFAGFAFSARKFHKCCEVGIFRTAADQSVTIFPDYGCGNINSSGHGRNRRFCFCKSLKIFCVRA